MKIIENPDTKIRNSIRKALKENNNYCPCKLEQIPENKCICKEFREQSDGMCHCGVFIKVKEEDR